MTSREQVADLSARAAKAHEYMTEAEAAGDAERLRRATERYFYRLAQHEHLAARPEDAWCRQCRPAFQARLDGAGQVACLDHADALLRGRAWRETVELLGLGEAAPVSAKGA